MTQECHDFGWGPAPDPLQRLGLVLRLARRNFQEQSGGPFAAAVFRMDTWELVSAGVNRVVPGSCSAAHAEIVALTLAQNFYASFDLGASNLPPHELVASWRPCAMCFGALPWSGVRSLLLAGSGDELEQLTGFDEGPIHPEWQGQLAKRGINVQHGSTQHEAVSVFRDFAASGALVYNGRRGG
ncbi:MAG TPA: nucleoside deaminase [Polyangiaceae bacterium]|nr:nucleoside deaminase [Polyangiaceae bacterium]